LQGAIVEQNELLSILLLGKKFPEKPISPDWWDDVDCEAVQISRFQHGEPEEAPAYLLRLIHWLTILYRYVLDRPQGRLCRGCFDAVLDKLAGIWLLPPDAVGRLALARTMDNLIERKMVDVREGGGVAGEILCCADGHKAETISLNAEGRSYLRNPKIIMNWDYIQSSMFFRPIQPVKRRYMLDEIEEQLNGVRPIDIPLMLSGFRAYTAGILRDLGSIKPWPHFTGVKNTFRKFAGYFLAFPETVPIGTEAAAFADDGKSDTLGKLLKTIDETLAGWSSKKEDTSNVSEPTAASAPAARGKDGDIPAGGAADKFDPETMMTLKEIADDANRLFGINRSEHWFRGMLKSAEIEPCFTPKLANKPNGYPRDKVAAALCKIAKNL
jgi:hypothetical protein